MIYESVVAFYTKFPAAPRSGVQECTAAAHCSALVGSLHIVFFGRCESRVQTGPEKETRSSYIFQHQ